MTKTEFEALTIRSGEQLGSYLYDAIEYFYMSGNDYHKHNNPEGADESKVNFCKRVFGGKVNTAKTILKKTIAEAVKENNFALRGNAAAIKDKLDFHARLIVNQLTGIAEWH